MATCLRDDLRSAGPRFSIEFTSPPADVRVATSVPPSDEPLESAGPGSGGFIEDWDRPDLLPEAVKRMLGSMHGALGEPADTAIALRVDGFANTWLVFWSGVDHLDQVAGFVDQVQDTVAETLTEMWPLCPKHDDHMLDPRPVGGHVEWQCPETGASIARFGQLASVL